MKNNSFLYLAIIFLFYSSPVSSQTWIKMMQNPDANFYDIQNEFNNYWSQPDKMNALAQKKLAKSGKNVFSEEDNLEVAGWIQFKRWEWFKQSRVYPSGELIPPDDYFHDLMKKSAPATRAGSWSFIGISNTPSNVYPYSGMGRVNCVRFDPANSNTIYAGTPSGGLWKSTNNGNAWTQLNTDGLGSLGISDIAIDPTNSQVIYLASGDRDGVSTYGLGVLKSINGGLTWNSTGLNWLVSQVRTANKILIDPTNTQIIHVATSNGIYRSINGGTSFTQVSSLAQVGDMEFKPGDPTVIYASTDVSVYRSLNSGLSYSSVYSVSGAGGIALATTAANANYVYALATDASTYGFKGVYRSSDGGSTFNLMSNSPNILGSDCNGSDNAGQGWYNLAIAVSPVNEDEVFVGGIWIWGSADGGASWSVKGSYDICSDYVFPDVHDLIFLPGSSTTFYVGCDGGVFSTQNNGATWTGLNNGLEISQQYTLGQSTTNGSKILTSCQDVGTDLLNGTTWTRTQSGEATEVFFDRTNNNTMYGGGYNGQFARSTDGGATFVDIVSGLTGYGAWVSPWMQDLTSPLTLWAGYQEIFKSIDQGTNWTQMSSLGGAESFIAIDQAPSNHQVIYAAGPTSIIKTINGGTFWTNITGNLPVGSAQIKYIEINPTNENQVWVTFSGYSAANKVWVTSNGGTLWTNYSTGLPNIPTNCIVYENNSLNGTLYAGTDLGVYIRNSAMAAWTSYNSGLPNVVVNELEIQYTIGKIRAATYGRGMWESELAGVSVGILSSINELQVDIFPNPSKGVFTIKAEKLKIKNIEAFNVIGESVYLSAAEGIDRSGIDLSSKPNGIYFIHVICDEGTVVKKITINK